MADKTDTGSVVIPDNWRDLSAADIMAIAKKITDAAPSNPNIPTPGNSVAIVEAELERRDATKLSSKPMAKPVMTAAERAAIQTGSALPGLHGFSTVAIPDDWRTLSVKDTIALSKKITTEPGNPTEIIEAELKRRNALKPA